MELSDQRKNKMKNLNLEYMDAEASHPLLTKIITLCGVVFVVLASTIIFDMFYEFTFFNAMFNHADWENAMSVWAYGSIIENSVGEVINLELFDNVGWFGPSPSGLICFIFSILFLICLWLVIYVIMIYVKLYAMVIRGLINTFRITTVKTTNEIKTNLKESGKILGIDVDSLKKEQAAKPAKTKKPKAQKVKDDVSVSEEYSDADLDALLSSPTATVATNEETPKEETSYLD